MNKLRYILEAAYIGNIGFEEMIKLYQKATPKETKQIEKVIADEDWNGYKKLVKKILNVNLK